MIGLGDGTVTKLVLKFEVLNRLRFYCPVCIFCIFVENISVMKKSREEILKAIKQTLKTITPDARAILFGSQARGDSNPDSDWDILIILDKSKIEPSDFDTISYPLYELGWNEGEHFSAKLYTKSEWQKRSFTPFFQNVEKEGILLLSIAQ